MRTRYGPEMAESDSQPFSLDPVPPEVRAASKRARKDATRRSVSKIRQQQAEAGVTRLDVAVGADLVRDLDRLKSLHGFRNRSEALEHVLRLTFQQKVGGAVTT